MSETENAVEAETLEAPVALVAVGEESIESIRQRSMAQHPSTWGRQNGVV